MAGARPAALLRGAAADHGLPVGGWIGAGALPARLLRESVGEVLRGADDLLVLLRRKRAGAALQAVAVGADELVLAFRRPERKTGRGAGREPDRAKQQRVVLGEIDDLVARPAGEARRPARGVIGLLGGAAIGRGRGLGRRAHEIAIAVAAAMGRSGMPALAAAPAPRRLGLGIAAPCLRDGLGEPGGGGGHGRRGVAERLGDARDRVGRPARGGACRRAHAPGARADASSAAADHVGRRADEALAGLRPAHRDGKRRSGRDPERAEEPRVGADPVVGVASPLVSVLGSARGTLIGVMGGRARPRRDVLGGGARAIERIGGRLARAIERIRGRVAGALGRLGDAGTRLGGGLAGPPADLARPFADLGRQRARLAARRGGFRHDAVGRRRARRILLDRVAVAGDAARDVAARLLCVIGRPIGGRIARALATGAHQ